MMEVTQFEEDFQRRSQGEILKPEDSLYSAVLSAWQSLTFGPPDLRVGLCFGKSLKSAFMRTTTGVVRGNTGRSCEPTAGNGEQNACLWGPEIFHPKLDLLEE